MAETNYLILGAGFIGTRMHSFLENSVISERRINSAKDAEEEIEKFSPGVVINCIGRTGAPNIDWCETHKLETIKANVTVPLLILEACRNKGKYMVHMGTGCQYTGDNNGKGFSEEDAPNFFGSFYSRTKIFSEKMLKEFDVLQLRLRMPFDDYPGGRNLINKLVKYKRIISIPNSVTYIPDFLAIAKQLMEKRAAGVYNIVNKNPVTHAEILDLYKDIVDKSFEYEIISLEELYKVAKAERSNCTLNIEKLEKEGIKVRGAKEALKECLSNYRKNLGAGKSKD